MAHLYVFDPVKEFNCEVDWVIGGSIKPAVLCSISGVELERLMIAIVCVVNALLLLFLILGTWDDELDQKKAINILKLVPDDLFFNQEKIIENTGCCGSDLNLILLLAKCTLREAHPVFGMCLQVMNGIYAIASIILLF